MIRLPVDPNGEPELLCDINTTPLIDVMLVLLIMLIVTIPIQLHAVDLVMPAGTTATAVADRAAGVRVDIDGLGRIFWNGLLVADEQALDARLCDLAVQSPLPELQLRPDARARYAVVAGVLAATRRHGLTQVAMLGGEQFD